MQCWRVNVVDCLSMEIRYFYRIEGKGGILIYINLMGIEVSNMAQLIVPSGNGDTPKQVEDKVRALPANQGLNEYDMWQKIDTEVAAASAAGKLRSVEVYKSGNTGDKHGNK